VTNVTAWAWSRWGQRNAGVGRHAERGGDARHHLEGHAVLREGLDLLAAAAEHEGVAALEPQHPPALLRQAHHQRVDRLLAVGVVVALLAHVDALDLGRQQLHDRLGHQVVVQHHVGLLHQAQRAQG